MKIAIPTANNLLCPHFGHCEEFTFVSVNPETKQIELIEKIPAPEHQPGLLPKWIQEQGAHLVIAGGMGGHAQQIFAANGVNVLTGVKSAPPKEVVEAFLQDSLETGENVCDH